MTSPPQVIFANPARTAIGPSVEASKKSRPQSRCRAIKAGHRARRSQADEVGTRPMGNVIQAGTKMNPARQAAIHGGLRCLCRR